MAAIAVANGGSLAVDLKGTRDLAGSQHRERQLLLIGQPPPGGRGGKLSLLAIDLLQQDLPVAQPFDLKPLSQTQAVDTKVPRVRAARDLPGIMPGSEKAGMLARPGQWTFHKKRRQVDAARYAIVAGP